MKKCPICLEEALEVSDKRGPKYQCKYCNAAGDIKKLEIMSQNVLDDRWAFYYCEKLQLGLFFRNSYEYQRVNIIDRIWVSAPDLQLHGHDGSDFQIKCCGVGIEGLERLKENPRQTETIFPVNLYKNANLLKPRPSRTVTHQMAEEWQQIRERFWSVK
jgi:hypothetical protein